LKGRGGNLMRAAAEEKPGYEKVAGNIKEMVRK